MPEIGNLRHPVAIGAFSAAGNVFLAPVAGYSDAAYRSVCIDHGCDFTFTEMVSTEALIRSSPKTRVLLERAENEKDYAVQLFGSKPDVFARAAAMAKETWMPAVIDVNCGCPVPKIVKTGAGSALMKTPESIGDIVRAIVGATGLPVTVKLRLGWDDSSINFMECAEIAAKAGAAALTLHARTRAQAYSGKADWGRIEELAKAFPSLPVFASGDIFSGEAARSVIERTGCSGVMLARGAMGNPFAFATVRAALEGRPEPAFGAGERLAAARKHLGLSVRFLGERTACVEFRKHVCAYLKGIDGGAELRAMAVACSTRDSYDAVFDAWEKRLNCPGRTSSIR